MIQLLIISVLIFCEQVTSKVETKFRVVEYEDGIVSAEKYWNGDFYEFFGVPYASAPKGRDRFKPPLPVKPWEGVFEAKSSNIACQQTFYTGEDVNEIHLTGQEDCLVLNLFVPEVASEDSLVPVVVYIHSGAYAAGNGNMARYHSLVKHDILVISLNYRLGATGFACLGTEDIPGNAGMKDQVAALRWININIKKFGGDPEKVTIAGFSVGAAMAELLVLSKSTEGLIDKLILESGSALSPFTINRDPISTAYNIAVSIGYNGTRNIKDINEFYLSTSDKLLAAKSLNFFLTNSTFGFSPCIENDDGEQEHFITESPLDILNKGDHRKVAVLTGFANMEGLSRTVKFSEWSEMMNEDFAPFLPADLKFDNDITRTEVIEAIKKYYFKEEDITHDTLQGYIDYFSDSMFKYSILHSANLHSIKSEKPVYFYEFTYVGRLNMRHQFMETIKGASHRDQTSYVLDFFGFSNGYDDLDMRDRMTEMWSNFIKHEDPTEFESLLINYKWKPYSTTEQNYLLINKQTEMRKDLLVNAYKFWKKIYDRYYWNPSKVPSSLIKVRFFISEELRVKKNKRDKSNSTNEFDLLHFIESFTMIIGRTLKREIDALSVN